MKIDFNAFLESLPTMLYGMAGIFIVIFIIFISILLLNKFFKNKEDK